MLILEDKLLNALDNEKVDFLLYLKNLQIDFNLVTNFNIKSNMKDCTVAAIGLREEIEKAKMFVKDFNDREHLL